jgi:hypothetical protein
MEEWFLHTFPQSSRLRNRGVENMRSMLAVCVVLGIASIASAKEPKAYQAGKLVQMDSVSCGVDERDSGHKKTHEILCQEYVVQTERVTYRIRPRDDRHTVLLPVSERAQFRMEKDRMVLRVEDFDNKDREYTVVSIAPRSDGSAADASTVRVNHLQ